MTLDETIDNFEREIVEFEGLKKICAVTYEDYAKIERTRYLVEWLKELQTYRKRECETCKYSEDGKCAGTEKCHECMWKNQYEQEPMREFTKEEAKAYSKALDKMYKPTGFNVFEENDR